MSNIAPKKSEKKRRPRCPCGEKDRISRCIKCNPNQACEIHKDQLKEKCNICKARFCKEHPDKNGKYKRKDRCTRCKEEKNINHDNEKVNEEQ